MSDDTEPTSDTARGDPAGARVRRSLTSGRMRLRSLVQDLVDRHSRFMAFVWGPDWEACHADAMARATERRRSNG
jgi:hypothetical protein